MDRRLKKSTILLGFQQWKRTILEIAFALIFISISSPLFAEYRAYQYYVVPKGRQYYQTNKAYMIKSSLDPVSYLSYHGGADSISLTTLRSWKCPGNTSHSQVICDGPYKKLSDEIKEEQKNKKESQLQSNDNTNNAPETKEK